MGWQARAVAQATRHLSPDACTGWTGRSPPAVSLLPWTRFEVPLQAKIIEADPAQPERRARIREAERFVRTGRATRDGLLTLVARANAGDVMATANQAIRTGRHAPAA